MVSAILQCAERHESQVHLPPQLADARLVVEPGVVFSLGGIFGLVNHQQRVKAAYS